MHARVASFLIVALAVSSASGQEKAHSPRGFDKIHALVRPDPGELRIKEIPFVPTLWEARKKAAEEGKPILLIGSQGNGLAISRG